jgi:hypothetical protein
MIYEVPLLTCIWLHLSRFSSVDYIFCAGLMSYPQMLITSFVQG